jgi:hypothetical protein
MLRGFVLALYITILQTARRRSLPNPNLLAPVAEHCRRVIYAPASYSGASGVKSRPGDRLEIFVVFLSPSR